MPGDLSHEQLGDSYYLEFPPDTGKRLKRALEKQGLPVKGGTIRYGNPPWDIPIGLFETDGEGHMFLAWFYGGRSDLRRKGLSRLSDDVRPRIKTALDELGLPY